MTPRRAVALGSVVVAVAAGATLLFAARAESDALAPLPIPDGTTQRQLAARTLAAQHAHGRRVLLVRGPRGSPRDAAIVESGRAPAGWSFYAGAPAGRRDLAELLDGLARRAADAWDPATGLPPAVVRALELLDVKAVLVDGGRDVELPSRFPADGSLAPGKGAPILRVTRAEPVVRIASDAVPSGDALAMAASLGAEPASILDPEDTLWGGAVTVDAPVAGRYLFAWPAGAASVTIDGRDATPVAGWPVLVLDLPAGRSRVVSNWVTADVRGWVVIGATALLGAAVVTLLLALRPTTPDVLAAADAAP